MENEETVQCPFEISHRILPLDSSIIWFAASALIPTCISKSEQKFSEHVANCPSRASVERMIYGGDAAHPLQQLPYHTAVDEENWENELVSKSYDPMSKCLASDVPLIPRNLTKSQRRAFRESEIDRLSKIKAESQKNKSTTLKKE
ncbi:Gametocyte-specific factor 1 [Caligus rogercresseyi]|uniref:Gametocyte-specific factor 1 n=1 Tax=Caligus rogercresseyi TaxID=217165 RepID=A0A7T8JY30_CALRO|nr:Gametocyte-specific factor 1 [Caligus rogercresseyi]